MVSTKRTAVFPLRITRSIPFPDGDPPMPTNRLALPHISLFKPWNHQRCFGFELPMSDIVVRQSEKKCFLSGHKTHGYEIASFGPLRIIEAAVIRLPIQIPRTAEIWH